MKHYLKKLEETIRGHWNLKALCDYKGDAFTYGDLAANIEQFRLFLNDAGIADCFLGHQCQWLRGSAAFG